MEKKDRGVATQTRLTITQAADILRPISWSDGTRSFGPEGEAARVHAVGQGFGNVTVTVRGGTPREKLSLYDAARAVERGLALFPQ